MVYRSTDISFIISSLISKGFCCKTDWEAIADQTPEPSSHSLVTVEVSKLSLNNQSRTSKQRGRGAFTYGQNALYSDQTSEFTNKDKAMDQHLHEGTDELYTNGDCKFSFNFSLVLSLQCGSLI